MTTMETVEHMMARLGVEAKKAAQILASTKPETKNAALLAAADLIQNRHADILAANQKDMQTGRTSGLTSSFLDRLELDDERLTAIEMGIRAITSQVDPVGEIIAEWDVASGLHIQRVRTPLGVIGVIFESRPNVTADAAALCLKAGNAAILRGGSDSFHSSRAIHSCFVEALESVGLPVAAIQMVPTTDRAAVGEMLKGLNGAIDVIVPRGGKGLVARVQTDARVPVFAHLEGICHVYIDQSAELEMAVQISLNAKMRRTSICGAAETLLVHRACVTTHLSPIMQALSAAGCELRGDDEVLSFAPVDASTKKATEQDWVTEYGEPVLSVKIVDSIEDAITHIETYSSHHTEAIVTGDENARDLFFARVDSAILLHNASTQFADGAEFGMGAEIGIATGKMHARGPVGVEQLTSFKYLVHGTGQTRP